MDVDTTRIVSFIVDAPDWDQPEPATIEPRPIRKTQPVTNLGQPNPLEREAMAADDWSWA